jgi:PPM family protein phosphatase
MVADGLVGHQAGDVAANLAITTITETLKPLLGSGERPYRGIGWREVVRRALVDANNAIHSAARQDARCGGMGATVVLALAREAGLTMAHVGDCRLYLYRDHNLTRLTSDHSVVQQMLDRGACTVEEARRSGYRHVVTRALGVEPVVEVDIAETDAVSGDLYLLCSDGLTDMMPDREIAATLEANPGDLNRVAEALVMLANLHGGKDNISVILARYG